MYVKPETRNLIHCLQIVENTLGARTTIPVHSMEMAICAMLLDILHTEKCNSLKSVCHVYERKTFTEI